MTTYTLCKRVIENGTYGTAGEMQLKLDVFLMNDRITEAEYHELNALLDAKEAAKNA